MTDGVLSEFLSQLPLGLVVQTCGFGLLLVGALVYLYYIRPRRRRAKMQREAEAAQETMPEVGFTEQQPPPQPEPYPAPVQSHPRIDTGQLPDLDMLLGSDKVEAVPASRLVEAEAPPPAPSMPTAYMSGGTHSIELYEGGLTDATELVTVLRDEDDGRLIVQIGNTAYRSLTDDAEAKREFVKIMKELSDVVTTPDPREPGDYRQIPAAPEVQPESKPSELDKPPVVEEQPQADVGEPSLRDLLDDEPDIISDAPPPLADGSMPGDLPSFKIDDSPVKTTSKGVFRRKVKTEVEPVPEVNIGQAIEDYLQHKLSHTQELAGRSIHVRFAPGNMLAIEVDGKFYEAVSDVEDEQVRRYLQETIQEWHERQG